MPEPAVPGAGGSADDPFCFARGDGYRWAGGEAGLAAARFGLPD